MLLTHLAIPSRRHSVIQLLLVDVGHMLIHEGEGQGEEEAEHDEEYLDDVGVGDGVTPAWYGKVSQQHVVTFLFSVLTTFLSSG